MRPTVEDYSKIKIEGDWVGLIGLKGAIEEAKKKGFSDEELKNFLFEKVKERNYIPQGMEGPYKNAIYREYCRVSGISYKEEEKKGIMIQILGPGCHLCDGLEREVMAVLSDLAVPADIEHIRNPKEIASFGVMGTPALVINGKVVSVGKVPTREQIRKWIEKA